MNIFDSMLSIGAWFLEAILWMHRNLSLLPSAMFDQGDKHGLRLFADF